MKDKAAAQTQGAADILGVETLPGVRELEPVVEADRHAGGVQVVIGQRDRCVVAIDADAMSVP